MMYIVIAIIFIAFLTRWYFSKDKTDYSKVFKGKKVLITGASQNIGEQFAYFYAEHNARILLTSRSEEKLQIVAKKCMECGAQAVDYLVCDMALWETESKALVKQAVEKLGGLDLLVLNHVNGKHKLWEDQEESMQYMKDSVVINYFSCVAMANAALPSLQRSGGSILVIGSGAGKGGMANTSAYGASKAALANFFESLSIELLETNSNVSITLATFGAIATNNTRWGKHLKIKGYPMKNAVQKSAFACLQRKFAVYCPEWIKWLCVAKIIAPSAVNYMTKLLFNSKNA